MEPLKCDDDDGLFVKTNAIYRVNLNAGCTTTKRGEHKRDDGTNTEIARGEVIS